MFSLIFLEAIFSVQKTTYKNNSLLSPVPRSKLSFHKSPRNLYAQPGLWPSQGVGLRAQVLAVETPSKETGALSSFTFFLGEIFGNF